MLWVLLKLQLAAAEVPHIHWVYLQGRPPPCPWPTTEPSAVALHWHACGVLVTLHRLPRRHCTMAAPHMHIAGQSVTTTSTIGGENAVFSARACIAGMALL
eukprot:2466636-Amphidinium_carterae.1